MRKFFLMVAAVFAFTTANAQLTKLDLRVGDAVYIDANGNVSTTPTEGATKWIVGPNEITTNSDFNDDPAKFGGKINGWKRGDYQDMTTGTFNWVKEGGVDGGPYLQANKHTGAAGDGSVGQRWNLTPQNKYYFSFWVNKNSDKNQYIPVISITDAVSEKGGQNEYVGQGTGNSKMLLGKNGEDKSETTFGYAAYNNGDWAQTAFTFDSENYTFFQFNARWLKEGAIQAGFDKFYLAKLYDENTPVSTIVFFSLSSKIEELNTFMYSADIQDYEGLSVALSELSDEASELDENSEVDAMTEMMARIDKVIAEAKQGVADAKALAKLITEADALAASTEYPGKEVFEQAIVDARTVSDDPSQSTAADYANALTALTKAIKEYRLSQEASDENPADYSFMVQNPRFTTAATQAEESNDNRLQDPWIKGSTYTGGDQRTNYTQNRTCWNAWWNVNVATAAGQGLDIHQNLTGLPTGYYGISVKAITQPGCLSNQHAYATSTTGTAVSPNMTITGWNDADATQGEWESLKTTKILVTDGKLTIGFASDKTGTDDTQYATDDREGWWCVTDFALQYYGKASEEDVKTAYNKQLTAANELAESMHFAGDKSDYQAAIAYASNKTTVDDINIALDSLQKATVIAKASEDKYKTIWSDGKILKIMTDSIAKDENAYGAAKEIAIFAYNSTVSYTKSAKATYKVMDNKLNRVWRYADNYAKAYNTADKNLNEFTTETAKAALKKEMDSHKVQLMAADTLLTTAEVDSLITLLNKVVTATVAQNNYEKNPDATDYTSLIINPSLDAETGWTFVKGNGNTNTNAGQHYTGDAKRRYIDSWNGTAGALNFYADQKIVGIPNGTYTVKAAGRASGKGAFIFASNGGTAKSDTTYVEIQGYSNVVPDLQSTLGGDSIFTGGDKYGKIWEEAYKLEMAGNSTPESYAIYSANTNLGFGWGYVEVANYEVTNHEIVIGVTTDSVRTVSPFKGTWFSVTDWTLTLVKKGDNSDWNGPLTGINTVENKLSIAADGVYNLQGMKMNAKAALPKGVYIIREGNKAKKVFINGK